MTLAVTLHPHRISSPGRESSTRPLASAAPAPQGGPGGEGLAFTQGEY